MQKREMLKLMTAVTLLISAPAMDAAPWVSEAPDHQQVPLNRGDQKSPDPWTSGPDIKGMTATGSFAKLLKTGPVTMFSNGHGKTVGASHRLDKTTSSPSYMDKTMVATNSLDRQLKIASVTIDSDEQEKIVPATNNFDGGLKIHSMMDDSETKEHTTTEGFYRRLKLMPVTTHSNKQSKTLQATKRAQMSMSSSSPDRREKIRKMLSALEELHRSMNSTLSSRITIIPRGNSNGRSSGKKSKMVVTEGNLKSTTVPSVGSSGTSPRTSTDQADPKLLNGKTFKKSLPSTPKKTNKRVCFWKYCSQN
ncbi:urotensin II-related peptide [Colossoma macropomum]|uniref:urotensin II-related peptide n=1 Tax=Colossoma macropomum TaxID=42526 RepID=UPI0018643EB5|nr:urotensin II-related peptide [Colossoma macropomum]